MLKSRAITLEDIAENADAIREGLENVWQKSFHAPLPDGYSRQAMDRMNTYVQDGTAILLGAFDGSNLAGLVWAYPRNTPEGMRLHITEYFVTQPYVGQGVGRLLLITLMPYAQKHGANEIELMVSTINRQAKGFYEHIGFKKERICMTYPVHNEMEDSVKV